MTKNTTAEAQKDQQISIETTTARKVRGIR